MHNTPSAITRIKLKRFTAFESLDLLPSPGVNALLGANGTGKTHLMKVAYAACDATKPEVRFPDKLVRLFMPSNRRIGRLVKRRRGGSQARVEVSMRDTISDIVLQPYRVSGIDQAATAEPVAGGGSIVVCLHTRQGNAGECAWIPLVIFHAKYSLSRDSVAAPAAIVMRQYGAQGTYLASNTRSTAHDALSHGTCSSP